MPVKKRLLKSDKVSLKIDQWLMTNNQCPATSNPINQSTQ